MKRTFTVLILSLTFLIVSQINLAAQVIRVQISVTNTTGDPMPGVSIKVVGTTDGVVTGADGKVTIYCLPTVALKFEYINYITQTVQVNNRTVIDVVMEEDLLACDINTNIQKSNPLLHIKNHYYNKFICQT